MLSCPNPFVAVSEVFFQTGHLVNRTEHRGNAIDFSRRPVEWEEQASCSGRRHCFCWRNCRLSTTKSLPPSWLLKVAEARPRKMAPPAEGLKWRQRCRQESDGLRILVAVAFKSLRLTSESVSVGLQLSDDAGLTCLQCLRRESRRLWKEFVNSSCGTN